MQIHNVVSSINIDITEHLGGLSNININMSLYQIRNEDKMRLFLLCMFNFILYAKCYGSCPRIYNNAQCGGGIFVFLQIHQPNKIKCETKHWINFHTLSLLS